MRIYPDPELPDVKVTWYEDDCSRGSGDVSMTLIGMDSDVRVPLTVPCSDLKTTLVDVARERYRFEAFLQGEDGEALSRNDSLIDLRDGIDERIDLYFGGFANFRVAWTFDMGATCESLGAEAIALTFSYPDRSPAFQSYVYCELTPFLGRFPGGTYTLQLRAVKGSTTVASSPESDEFEILEPDLTDLGTVTLTP